MTTLGNFELDGKLGKIVINNINTTRNYYKYCPKFT